MFQVMGGQGSDMFEYFKILILQGLIAARKHSERIMALVDIMRAGKLHWLDFLNLWKPCVSIGHLKALYLFKASIESYQMCIKQNTVPKQFSRFHSC